MSRAVRAGVALGWSRLGPRRLAIVAGLDLAGLVLVALLVRASAPLEAPDALLSVAFRALLPLVAWYAVAAVSDRASLDQAAWAVARHGASRRAVALGLLGAALAGVCLAFVAPLAVGLALAYGTMPGLAHDLATTLGLATLGAAGYVALLGVGSTTMRHGRGRGFFLLLDALFGGAGVLGLGFPRGHLASLLGGPALAGLSQRGSSALVGLCAALLVGVALVRTPE